MHNLYQEVTDSILQELRAGCRPWVQSWSLTPGLNVAANAVSKHEYRGINRLLLLAARARRWPQPRFLTFSQARAAGGHVKKGEHGFRVVFFGNAEQKSDDPDDTDTPHRYNFLKSFVVFNLEQCEDLPASITKPVTAELNHDRRDNLVDEFIAATGAKFHEKPDADEAYYSPAKDCIVMPPFAAFCNRAEFYACAFHELCHWTGHASRLDRQLGGRFGQHAMAAEELIAELGAAFLCAEFNVDGYVAHAAYLSHYLKLLEHDNRAIFTAAARAQSAVDYLRETILKEPIHQAAE